MRKQIALCIGNDEYQYTCLNKLQCAVNDCEAVAEKLRSLDFDVMSYNNLNHDTMHKVVDEFELRLPEYDIALFYYAGHGFECNGSNLLMPIDTDGTDRGYRDWMALKLEYVIDALEGKNKSNNLKTKIIILDACRENGDGRGAVSHSFAPVFAPGGTIIAFSTSPGQKAVEFGDHGAYTKALLQSIDLPRVSIENMFKHVREILSATTNGRQISWEHTSLIGNYCFNEDCIDAFSFYSSDALADKNYYYNTNNPLYQIINNLKSRNWYSQNSAIESMYKLPFDDVSINDLFVLGRNIYQAATGGAWDAHSFIRNFLDNKIPLEIKVHILSGMSYEIYYNSYGQLRQFFKSDLYIDILRIIENEDYQLSKNFILAKLSEESDRLVYIPSSENKIELHLITKELETRDNGDIIYSIQAIYNQGINVLYSADGTAEIGDEDFIYYRSACNLSSLRVELSKALVAPPDMTIITIDTEDSQNHYFELPPSFSLRKSKVTY